LADTFAPLASRAFRRKKRHSLLEERIRDCLALQRGEIERKQIKCHVPHSETHVATDPGELDGILLNLLTNAVYWLGEVPRGNRVLEFRLMPVSDCQAITVRFCTLRRLMTVSDVVVDRVVPYGMRFVRVDCHGAHLFVGNLLAGFVFMGVQFRFDL